MRRDLLPDPLLHPVSVPTVPAAGARAVVAATLAAMLFVIAAHWPTAFAMGSVWARSDTFAHGFLVLPLSAWLAWRERQRWLHERKAPALRYLVAVALAGFAWLVGELATVNALSQFALVAMFALAVPVVAGSRAAGTVLFPLGFLFFAVPFGEFLLPQLMEWTATFTVMALKATGVPVYREGLHLVVPSGNWSVVEACSGVRYLIASMTIGTLFAYLTYRSTSRRVAFFIVSMLVPIVANWVRAFLIVLLGHLSNNRLAAGVDHLIYGWVFFGAVMMLMFWIGARWREDDPVADGAKSSAPKPVAQVAHRPPRAYWLAAAAYAAVVAIPIAADRAIEGGDPAGPVTLAFPAGGLGGWQPVAPAIAWRPSYSEPNASHWQQYAEGSHAAAVFVGYYRDQTRTRKLVSSSNELAPTRDTSWARVTVGTRAIALGGAPVVVETATLRSPYNERLRVWRWYWVNGQITGSESWAKAYTALSQLSGRGDASAVVVVAAPVTSDVDGVDAADAVLTRFADAVAAPVATMLGALGQPK